MDYQRGRRYRYISRNFIFAPAVRPMLCGSKDEIEYARVNIADGKGVSIQEHEEEESRETDTAP